MRPDIRSEILLESAHPHVDHRTGHNRTKKTTRREDQNAAIDRGDLSGLGNFPHDVLPCVVLNSDRDLRIRAVAHISVRVTIPIRVTLKPRVRLKPKPGFMLAFLITYEGRVLIALIQT